MKHVICPSCGKICIKYGKTKAGAQRWQCKECKMTISPKIDSTSKQLQIFLKWLFGKQTQQEMVGNGRTFRRKTAQFWDIWPMPPKIESSREVVYVDGIYMGRKACVLICCDNENVLGWYLCRYEHSGAYRALLSRIAEPSVVVSDGGTGFAKALKKTWPNTKHQRCTFHVFSQIRRYTTSRPKTKAGAELYILAKDLLYLENQAEMKQWIHRFIDWRERHQEFLSQVTRDENDQLRPTHERLLKAQNSVIKLITEGTMFTYLDEALQAEIGEIPAMNNRIEGGVNAQLRAMLREHRGLNIERRIKAVFWWCYMHSPNPLSASELIKVMPTDKTITEIYNKFTPKKKIDGSIPTWGDAIVWSELHQSSLYPEQWN